MLQLSPPNICIWVNIQLLAQITIYYIAVVFNYVFIYYSSSRRLKNMLKCASKNNIIDIKPSYIYYFKYIKKYMKKCIYTLYLPP